MMDSAERCLLSLSGSKSESGSSKGLQMKEFENGMAKKLSLLPQAFLIIFSKWKQATYVSWAYVELGRNNGKG